jgi:hypothetical protein
MRTLDAGTMGGDTGWPFRIVMLLVTLGGIFIVSALIGVLSAGVDSKLDELRKGRSKVLETDHTIILNWSPSIFDIISELVIANASRKRPRIVIMANKDKVEMEDEIASKIENLRNTRIICRSGDPTDLYDLSIVNPDQSRSIVILSPEADDPDSSVIKTILALTQAPGRRMEWIAALCVTMTVSAVVLVLAERIQRVAGDRFVVALERLMGLVLVAVSIEMMLRGIKTFARQLAAGV